MRGDFPLTKPTPSNPFRHVETGITAQQEESRRLVRAMMTLTGQSASGLAKSAGLTPSTLNRFMHRPVRHNLSQSTLVGLLTTTLQKIVPHPLETLDGLDTQALKCLTPALSLYRNAVIEQDHELAQIVSRLIGSSITPERETDQKATDLPVVLVTTQGIDIRRQVTDVVPFKTDRPPFLNSDALGFAIVMPDHSMAPRYGPDDLLYVSPSRTLEQPTQDVVIERKAGGFLIGYLAAVTKGHVALSMLQPKMTEFLPRDAVSGIYPIVGVRRP